MLRRKTFVSRSPRETQRFAGTLIHALVARGRGPIILALSGNLGSGKTTFLQGLARALGVREKVKSPTFVLAQWYELDKRLRPFRHFVHVDVYRLGSPREAAHFGLRDLLRDRDAIIAIEWADRVRTLIPKNAVRISFRHGKRPHERVIRFPNSKF